MSGVPDDLELHAFIDGELDAAHAAAIAARIEADPALARRVVAFRADKEMLKRIYAPVSDRPVPAEWIARAQAARKQPAVSWRLVGSIAAVILIAAIGAFAYLNMTSAGGDEVVHAALEARNHSVRAEKSLVVAASESPGQYDAVLSAAVATKVRAPDLRRLGYRLAGINLYGKAAELLYRDKENRLFTLYLRRSGGTPRFDQFARNGLRVCVWEDEELSTVMTGNVSTAAMQRLASLAYTDLVL